MTLREVGVGGLYQYKEFFPGAFLVIEVWGTVRPYMVVFKLSSASTAYGRRYMAITDFIRVMESVEAEYL